MKININYIYIVLAIVLMVVLYFIFKRVGVLKERSKHNSPMAVEIPYDVPTGASNTFDPTSLTDQLYHDITTVFSFRNNDLYKSLIQLSNAEIIAIYNDWNRRYYTTVSESLTTALDNEFLGWGDTPGNLFLSRLKSLKLN